MLPTRNAPGCDCDTAGGSDGASRNVWRTGAGRVMAEHAARSASSVSAADIATRG